MKRIFILKLLVLKRTIIKIIKEEMNEGQCCCPDSTAAPPRLLGCLLELDIRVSVECLQHVALFGMARILRKLQEVD